MDSRAGRQDFDGNEYGDKFDQGSKKEKIANPERIDKENKK